MAENQSSDSDPLERDDDPPDKNTIPGDTDKETKKKRKRHNLSLYRTRVKRTKRPTSPDSTNKGRIFFPIEDLGKAPKKQPRKKDDQPIGQAVRKNILGSPGKIKDDELIKSSSEMGGESGMDSYIVATDVSPVGDIEYSADVGDRIETATEAGCDIDSVAANVLPQGKSDERSSTTTAGVESDAERNEEESLMDRLISEMRELLFPVAEEMQRIGLLHEFVSFFRMVKDGSYPISNISFLLWLETVRWYSLSSTTAMTYSSDTMQFWECGYQLFHGKFIRFMSGPKHTGQVVSGHSDRGLYDPLDSQINFAVPDVSAIRKFSSGLTELPKSLEPGIISEALDIVSNSKENIPHVLSVDGKKVASGLNEVSGDVDLFGHEDNETLAQRKQRLDEESEKLTQLGEILDLYGPDLRSYPSPVPIVSHIKGAIQILSCRLRDLQNMKVKQQLGLKKFTLMAGEEWRTSKYVFAISGIQCQLYRINTSIAQALECNKKLCILASSVLGTRSLICDGSAAGLHMQPNAVTLKSPDQLPEEMKEDSQYIKQRTEEWHSIRAQVPVSGSTLYNAIGIGTLKEQQQHFDWKIRKIDPKPFSAETLKFMEHGTINEPNAVATLVTRILPLYYPTSVYCEEGVHVLSTEASEKPLLAVSPDGSIREKMHGYSVGQAVCGVEIKCPYPNEYKTPVQYSMPARYVSQVLAEMIALGVNCLIYIAYSYQSTTVFEVTFDNELWNTMLGEVVHIYQNDIPRRPTCTSAVAKRLKSELIPKFLAKNVKFLAEIPSVTAENVGILSRTDVNSPHLFSWNYEDDLPSFFNEEKQLVPTEVVAESQRILREVYQITRLKGTEVMVFMLSDVNRSWHLEIPHSIPVAYGLKGYSLTAGAMRGMLEEVLQACYDKGICVPCVSFDGQWVSLMTRDANGKPLTKLQLQKDIFSEAKAVSKTKMISVLKDYGHVKSVDQLKLTKETSGALSVERIDQLVYLNTPTNRDMWLGKVSGEKTKKDAVPPAIEWLPDEVLDSDVAAVMVDLSNDGREEEGEGIDTLPDLIPVQSTPEPEPEPQRQSAILTDIYLSRILDEWKKMEESKTKKRWANSTLAETRTVLTTVQSLNKLYVPELDIALETTMPLHQSTYKATWSKWMKVNFLSSLFGDGSTISGPKKTPKTAKIPLLRNLCSSVMSKYPKAILNCIYAQSISGDRFLEWKHSGVLTDDSKVNGLNDLVDWYYKPEYSQKRDQPEVKVLDGHHLLVNLRVKVCKDGLSGYRVSKKAWHDVAESNSEIISKALVCDLVDRQSGSFARRTFSEPVEVKMAELGYFREAHFVRLIREWYEAEDMPGIPAMERVHRRLALKEFLLHDVYFQQFPPPGMFVNGMSHIMFEGFLCSIDAHLQLYALCGMAYNQRAVGSQDVENFFSELTEMEPTKLGCPKGVNIGRLMSTATKLLQYRCDATSRVFSMWTTRSATYPAKPLAYSEDLLSEPTKTKTQKKIQSIEIDDHFFDTLERNRTKQKRKKGDVSAPDAPGRGVLGVRQHHRRDESKILPMTRLGKSSVDV